MRQAFLARCLKICTIVIALITLLVLFYLLPSAVNECVTIAPEYAYLVFPCNALIYFSSLPCILALGAFYLICIQIGRDNSFSYQNAKRLVFIAICAMIGVVLCAAECAILLFSNALHPGIALLCVIICFFGITVAAAAAILSHLVEKSVHLQEENKFTI